MKKLFYAMALTLYSASAMAETIFVIDDNGIVKSQMSTNVYAQPTVVRQVVTTEPTVTVVRQSPTYTNSYYYDNYSTGSAVLAGVTTAVVGALLFDGFKVKHHHHKAPAKITHHHKAPHGGGKHHR